MTRAERSQAGRMTAVRYGGSMPNDVKRAA
jgi:hypothetical protein